jgi:hypothetical protein
MTPRYKEVSFNDNSAVTFDLIPIRFNGEVGLNIEK